MIKRLMDIFRTNKDAAPQAVHDSKIIEFEPFQGPTPHMDLDEAANKIDDRLRAMGFIPTERCAKLGTGNTRNAITYSLHAGKAEIIPAKTVYVKLLPKYAGNKDVSLDFYDKTGATVLEIGFWNFMHLNDSAELTQEIEQYCACLGYSQESGVPMAQLRPQ